MLFWKIQIFTNSFGENIFTIFYLILKFTTGRKGRVCYRCTDCGGARWVGAYTCFAGFSVWYVFLVFADGVAQGTWSSSGDIFVSFFTNCGKIQIRYTVRLDLKFEILTIAPLFWFISPKCLQTKCIIFQDICAKTYAFCKLFIFFLFKSMRNT